MKKFLRILCLAACVFSITACSSNETTSIPNDAEYKKTLTEDVEYLSKTSDEVLNQQIAAGEFSEGEVSMVTSWITTREEVGEYVGVLDWKFSVDEDGVTVTANVDYTVRDAEVKVGYLADGSQEFGTFSPKYTLGEKMTKAALNTVIGISVVFVVLILISLIIWCFKFINKAEQALKNRKEKKSDVAAAAVDNTIAQIVQKEEEELVDDLELVAVISAAVAAYTGTSADGFVVRSIKKSNKKRWQNA